jgi:hypothetical protein
MGYGATASNFGPETGYSEILACFLNPTGNNALKKKEKGSFPM